MEKNYADYQPSYKIVEEMRKGGFDDFSSMYLAKHKDIGLIPLMNFMGNETINSFNNLEFLYAYCLENNITWLDLLGVKEEDISKPDVIY